MRAGLADGRRDTAKELGGPFRWAPLLYLAYARHDASIDGDAVATCAVALLDAGADPNAGYLWHGLPSPFTVVTGLLGEGELARSPSRATRTGSGSPGSS